jgi:5'-3' exonuclease
MGVPSFVSWISKIFDKKMINKTIDTNDVKFLGIDANGLFHPCCFQVLDYANTFCKDITQLELEKLMFKRITYYIDFVVEQINPEVCMIAVDGVAPLAKCYQQRYRRYKSVYDNELKNKIKEKYSVEKGIEWSNIVITPGTQFMEKLDEHLQKYFEKKRKESNIKYIYSSVYEPSEGEHKIIEYIRGDKNKKNKKEENNENAGKYVIYGNDADLIFLSMGLNMKNIYLFREDHELLSGVKKNIVITEIRQIDEVFCFLSIDILKDCYNKKIEETTKVKDDYCNDFIFLCYLLGNDFLPHLPSLSIKKKGLDIILDEYAKIYLKYGRLVKILENKNVTVNSKSLAKLLQQLGNKEEYYFRNVLPYFENRMKNKSMPDEIMDNEYKKELWKLENLVDVNTNVLKLGNGTKNEWKFRYYEHHFGASDHFSESVDAVCESYLEGMMWVLKYYMCGVPDWKWKYSYNNAPFVSDIADYMYKNFVNINGYKFKKNDPLTPEQQLLIVLPPVCNNLLPKKMQYLMTNVESLIYDMYPKKFKIDVENKDVYWQCHPILPYMDVKRILNAINQI